LVTAGRERASAVLSLAGGPEPAEATLGAEAWQALAARLRVLDAAGMDAAALLGRAAGGRYLDDADDIAAVLHWRLRGAEDRARLVVGETFTELSPSGDDEISATIA